jgi:excisionase family DNA binding protein
MNDFKIPSDADLSPSQLLILSELLKLGTRLANIEQAISDISTISAQISSQPEVEKPMGVKECAAFLGLEEPTIYAGVRSNTIPHYRPNGKILYFYASELNTWVKSKTKDLLIEAEAEQGIIRAYKRDRSRAQ